MGNGREKIDLEEFERRMDRVNEKVGGEEKKEGGTSQPELSRDFRMKSGNFRLDAGEEKKEGGELPEAFLEFAGDQGISLDHRDDYLAWWDCWCHGYNTAIEDIKKL